MQMLSLPMVILNSVPSEVLSVMVRLNQLNLESLCDPIIALSSCSWASISLSIALRMSVVSARTIALMHLQCLNIFQCSLNP